MTSQVCLQSEALRVRFSLFSHRTGGGGGYGERGHKKSPFEIHARSLSLSRRSFFLLPLCPTFMHSRSHLPNTHALLLAHLFCPFLLPSFATHDEENMGLHGGLRLGPAVRPANRPESGSEWGVHWWCRRSRIQVQKEW